MKVHELARDLEVDSAAVLDAAKRLNIEVSSHMASLNDQQAELLLQELATKSQGKGQPGKEDDAKDVTQCLIEDMDDQEIHAEAWALRDRVFGADVDLNASPLPAHDPADFSRWLSLCTALVLRRSPEEAKPEPEKAQKMPTIDRAIAHLNEAVVALNELRTIIVYNGSHISHSITVLQGTVIPMVEGGRDELHKKGIRT